MKEDMDDGKGNRLRGRWKEEMDNGRKKWTMEEELDDGRK